MYKCKHFKIQELVCQHTFKQYGESAWEFFDEADLRTLDNLRENLGRPITINNWNAGGSYNESGLRCPFCSLFKKNLDKGRLSMSAHNRFKGFDLKVRGMTTKEVHKHIIDNQVKYPRIKRLEHPDDTPTWVHWDSHGHHSGLKVFRP